MGEVPLYKVGEGGGSEGSKSGVAENPETRTAIFVGFLIAKLPSGEEVMFDLLQVVGSHAWPAVTPSQFLVKQERDNERFLTNLKK